MKHIFRLPGDMLFNYSGNQNENFFSFKRGLVFAIFKKIIFLNLLKEGVILELIFFQLKNSNISTKTNHPSPNIYLSMFIIISICKVHLNQIKIQNLLKIIHYCIWLPFKYSFFWHY